SEPPQRTGAPAVHRHRLHRRYPRPDDAAAGPSARRPAVSALLQALRQRAALNAMLRRFFAQREVLEVETPILSAAGNTEPNIDSFHTDFSGHRDAGARRR